MNKKTIVAGLIFSLASTISTGISAQVVQDPYFTNQYYLEMINVIDAWDITKGDPSVIVTITDEPIETNHEDISSSKIVQTYGGSAIA